MWIFTRQRELPTSSCIRKDKSKVPMEGASDDVPNPQVNILLSGLSCFAISYLTFHVPRIGNVQVPDYWKHFPNQKLNFESAPVSRVCLSILFL